MSPCTLSRPQPCTVICPPVTVAPANGQHSSSLQALRANMHQAPPLLGVAGLHIVRQHSQACQAFSS